MGMAITRPGNGYDGTTCLLQRAAGARTPWYLNHRVYPPGARAKEPTRLLRAKRDKRIHACCPPSGNERRGKPGRHEHGADADVDENVVRRCLEEERTCEAT